MKTALYVQPLQEPIERQLMTIWRVPENIMQICHGTRSRFQTVLTVSLPPDFSTESRMESRMKHTQIYDSNTYVKEYTYLGVHHMLSRGSM